MHQLGERVHVAGTGPKHEIGLWIHLATVQYKDNGRKRM
jgi:hypothetical protein